MSYVTAGIGEGLADRKAEKQRVKSNSKDEKEVSKKAKVDEKKIAPKESQANTAQ